MKYEVVLEVETTSVSAPSHTRLRSMEIAVRWSPFSTTDRQRFLIADVAGDRLQFCEVSSEISTRLEHRVTHEVSNLPNFTAFDWSRNDESIVAIGTVGGEARVIRLASQDDQSDITHVFPVRLQRKCNSIAFSTNGLLAAGLDRARNDSSLNVYDIKSQLTGSLQLEPSRKLSISEVVSNVKFFNDQADVLLAGIARQGIRMYDLRGLSRNMGNYQLYIRLIVMQTAQALVLLQRLLALFISFPLIL